MNDHSLSQERISYFEGRLMQIEDRKTDELKIKFHIDQDSPPSSSKEAIQRIKDGKVTYKEDKKETYSFNPYVIVAEPHWSSLIEFKDPNAPKPDKEGYEKALKELEQSITDLTDLLMVSDDYKSVLLSIQKFEDSQI